MYKRQEHHHDGAGDGGEAEHEADEEGGRRHEQGEDAAVEFSECACGGVCTVVVASPIVCATEGGGQDVSHHDADARAHHEAHAQARHDSLLSLIHISQNATFVQSGILRPATGPATGPACRAG